MLDKVFSDEAIKEISAQILEYAKKQDKESKEEIDLFKQKLADIKKKMDNLLDALEEGIIDKETIKERVEKYKQEKLQCELRLMELQTRSYDKILVSVNSTNLSMNLKT